LTVPKRPIDQVLEAHTPGLMELPGVVGTGQGLCDGEPCITVMLVARTSELDQKIPSRLEGYPVKIQVTGEIRARDDGTAGE